MPAEEYVAMVSGPLVLGDPCLRTQHFLGASKLRKISPDTIEACHQLRVPHHRYKDASMKEVIMKGHALSTNTHWYRLIDGEWKFAGLCPEIRWGEEQFDQIFAEGRSEMSAEKSQTSL